MLPLGFKNVYCDAGELFLHSKLKIAIRKTLSGDYELCSYTEGKGKEKGERIYTAIINGSYKAILEYLYKNY